jgi:hypothetical protein
VTVPPTASAYSPRLRTAVVLCGSGTSGVYQAGVLKALGEAGVKIDVLAGHGAGIVTALAGAIDGGARLWDPAGPWTSGRLRAAYRWRPALRVGAGGLLAAALLLLMPLVLLVVAAVIYALATIASLVSLTGAAERMVGWYQRVLEWLFTPPVLPTIMPRAVLLAVLTVAIVLLIAAVGAALREGRRRRWAGGFWWRLIGAPLTAGEPGGLMTDTLWQLVHGASNEPRPALSEIGRRYVDILTDNFGQPGFRELLIAVHDIDGRRDLVGAVLPSAARSGFEARRVPDAPREAEAVDFTGPQRNLLTDFLVGAWRLPLATAPHAVQFPLDSYWRGETHRICDRPELAIRLVDEIAAIGVEQVILVSAAGPASAPHHLRTEPVGLRARVGQFVRAIETAAMQDALAVARPRFSSVFVIRPEHNPIGPFDFAGVYDEASDRRRTVPELLEQGYTDAYRLFIEPVVATGDRIEA